MELKLKGSQVSTLSAAPALCETSTQIAVAREARTGLTSHPRTLSPWLFYDEAGSHLFEQITELPEYYLTRTERAIFAEHADEIIELAADGRCLTLVELGAGTASKTGILLEAAVRRQSRVTYQPVDVSQTALDEARENIERNIPGVTVRPQLADYCAEPIHLARGSNARVLALYIGSSIGNFSPADAREVLSNLRSRLEPGDTLLLGTDLAPSSAKSVESLLAAYDDDAQVTAAFNRNILVRLNRDLEADFDPDGFLHRAVWNGAESRIEMHLESKSRQLVRIPENSAGPSLTLLFEPGETIHTENSYKFTRSSVASLLRDGGFSPVKTFTDALELFTVTLAKAV
jgi:dimethylhistidine N-methyltransferase